MENSDKYIVFVSSIAAEQVKKQLEKRKTPNSHLRLGIRGGGCSGFSYVLQFEDKEPSKKDLLFEVEGIKVLIDNKSILYLNKCTLDWESTLMYKGFKFINPNELSKCGCGHSFTAK